MTENSSSINEKDHHSETKKHSLSGINHSLVDNSSNDLDEGLRAGIGSLGSLKAPSTSWDDGHEQIKPKRKNLSRIFAFLGLGVASFLFFVYMTFPYGVMKEVVVDRLTKEIQRAGMPIRVSIGSLAPHWLTGIELRDVHVNNVSFENASLKLNRATVYVNPFALLIGRISMNLYLTQDAGSMDLDLSIPISSILAGAPSPGSASVALKSFSLEPFFNHALAFAAGSQDPAMLLIAPIAASTKIGGNLSGNIDFSNDSPEHFGDAKGSFELSIGDGFLHIENETLKIRRQSFKTADLDLKFENNKLIFGEQTRFAAEDIEIAVNGEVTFPDLSKNPMQADLNLELAMRDKIHDTLGFIVPNMLRCPQLQNGVLKAKLTGPLSSMSCSGL